MLNAELVNLAMSNMNSHGGLEVDDKEKITCMTKISLLVPLVILTIGEMY